MIAQRRSRLFGTILAGSIDETAMNPAFPAPPERDCPRLAQLALTAPALFPPSPGVAPIGFDLLLGYGSTYPSAFHAAHVGSARDV
jgi:hypothetical protein